MALEHAKVLDELKSMKTCNNAIWFWGVPPRQISSEASHVRVLGCHGYIFRAPDKVHIFISILSISSANPV